jgi:hypothetical protein
VGYFVVTNEMSSFLQNTMGTSQDELGAPLCNEHNKALRG